MFISIKNNEKWRIIWETQKEKYLKAKGNKEKKLKILKENLQLLDKQEKE